MHPTGPKRPVLLRLAVNVSSTSIYPLSRAAPFGEAACVSSTRVLFVILWTSHLRHCCRTFAVPAHTRFNAWRLLLPFFRRCLFANVSCSKLSSCCSLLITLSSSTLCISGRLYRLLVFTCMPLEHHCKSWTLMTRCDAGVLVHVAWLFACASRPIVCLGCTIFSSTTCAAFKTEISTSPKRQHSYAQCTNSSSEVTLATF